MTGQAVFGKKCQPILFHPKQVHTGFRQQHGYSGSGDWQSAGAASSKHLSDCQSATQQVTNLRYGLWKDSPHQTVLFSCLVPASGLRPENKSPSRILEWL